MRTTTELAIQAMQVTEVNAATFQQIQTREMIRQFLTGKVSFTRTPPKNQRQRRKMWANNPSLRKKHKR